MTEESSDQRKEAQVEGLSRLTEKAKSTFWAYLGCEVVHTELESATIRLLAQPHHLNVLGVIHGGVLASLIDSAMGLVALQYYPGDKVVTANMNVYYLKSQGLGDLTCEAEIIYITKRTLTIKSSVFGEDGELLAWGSGSYRRII